MSFGFGCNQDITFNITYNFYANLPSGVFHINPTTITRDDLPLTLTDATLFGHTFDGWFDAEVGGNRVIEIPLNPRPQSNIPLYGRFTPNPTPNPRPPAPPNGGITPPDREGELLIWWPGAPVEIASLNRAIELYQAINPNVTFRVVPQASTNFFMQYMIARQGFNYPDIVFLDSVYVPQLANMGFITNLNEFDPAIETVIRPQVVESIWPANTFLGDAFALPVSANVLTLAYNHTLLNRVFQRVHGRAFADADVPSTWEEKMAICADVLEYNRLQGLTGGNALVPYTIPAGAAHHSMAAMYFTSMSARMGGEIMCENLEEIRLYSSQNVAAAQKIYDLGRNNFAPATFQEGAFEGGRVAFMEMGPWKIEQYQLIYEVMGHDLRFAPLVSLYEGGSRESVLGLFSMASSSGTINEELAVDFMKFFLTNDEVMLLHNAPQNFIPVTYSTIENEHFTQGNAWPVFMEQLNHVISVPATYRWAVLEHELGDFITRLLSGTRRPADLFDLHFHFSI